MGWRNLLIFLLVIATIFGAMGLYLVLTTPREAAPLRFPLTASQRALVARVPASAEGFALVPAAALLHRKLIANPVTRDAVERWTDEHPVPHPYLLGGADAVVWKTEKRTSYAIRLDAFRAFLVRLWLMSSTNIEGRWDGSVFVIGPSGAAMDARALDDVLRLTNGLAEGDVLVVQRRESRGMFPPIGRPAVTSVRLLPREILLMCRSAAASPPLSKAAASPPHSKNALISAYFVSPPRILDDAERLLGTDVSALVGEGGSIACYDIDAGTLLPRPKCVIVVPATERARAEMQNVARVAEVVGETRDTGREILIAFDRDSMPQYLKDTFVPAPWPATRWSVRIDAVRLAPILERLGDNRGLRFVAPRLHRAARDLRRWLDALRQAETIEAAESESGGVEELRVRIASK